MSPQNLSVEPKQRVRRMKLMPARPVGSEAAGRCGLDESRVGWLALSLGLLWFFHS
jgi:hypothetical protein